MQYFHISCGLRGAYLHDNGYIVEVKTRKELKRIVESEFNDIKDAGYVISKKELTATVADIWRNLKAPKRSPYAFVVSYGWRNSRGHGVNKCNAIHISHSTKADYLEYCEEGGS